jgi:hypothetical protein
MIIFIFIFALLGVQLFGDYGVPGNRFDWQEFSWSLFNTY